MIKPAGFFIETSCISNTHVNES